MRQNFFKSRFFNWIIVGVAVIAILIIARVCGIPIEFTVG